MKKRLRWCTMWLAVAMVIALLCGCGGTVSLAGTWYCADDTDSQLTLTKDGKFSIDGYGGEYSVENGQIVLVCPWFSEIVTISEEGGRTCLIDDDGSYWFQSVDAAENHNENKENELLEEAKAHCDGTYRIEADAERAHVVDRHLTFNPDGTYEYVTVINDLPEPSYMIDRDDSADAWQKGRWSLECDGDVVRVNFEPVESGGHEYSENEYRWTEGNNVPRYLQEMIVVRRDGEFCFRTWPLRADMCYWYKD